MGTGAAATADVVVERVNRHGDVAASDLAALLGDAVDSGASVGYHAPLDPAVATAWADDVLRDVDRGGLLLLVARDGTRGIVGTVQLALSPKPNAAHRADLQKLLVLRRHRGAGIGAVLMRAAEVWAVERGRTLLVLDTLRGDSGERLYSRLGWCRVGEIPRYTVEADGSYGDTVVFYKHLRP